jgi:hypothetical protein
MDTSDQYATIGLGRRTSIKIRVAMTLKARAGIWRSVQDLSSKFGRTLNEKGKTEGKPMEDKPFAVELMKLVWLPVTSMLKQPPLLSLITPL